VAAATVAALVWIVLGRPSGLAEVDAPPLASCGWAALIALAVAGVVVCLNPWSGTRLEARLTAIGGLLAVLLLPAVAKGALADEPGLAITGLGWLALAMLLRFQDTQPLWAGLAAGGLLAGAGWLDLDATLLLVPLLAGCSAAPHRVVPTGAIPRRPNHRLAAFGFALLVAGAAAAVWWSRDPEPLTRWVAGLELAAPPDLGARLQAVGVRAGTLVGIPAAIAAVVCGIAWLGSGAPGLLMAGWALTCHAAVVLVLVPAPPDALLWPALPWVAVVLALGWRSFHPGSRLGSALVLIALGLGVAALSP